MRLFENCAQCAFVKSLYNSIFCYPAVYQYCEQIRHKTDVATGYKCLVLCNYLKSLYMHNALRKRK